MAINQHVNKVMYGNQVVLDLTQDTAVAEDVAQGKTFHDATGALVTGTASGGGEERQTNFYPFTSYGAGANKNGCNFGVFTYDDLKKIKKIILKGKSWVRGGGTTQKITSVQYCFLGVKNGYWCWYNHANQSWVVSTSATNVTALTSFLNTIDTINIKVADFTGRNINVELDIEDIIASAVNQGISFELPFTSCSIQTSTVGEITVGEHVGVLFFSYVWNITTTSASWGFSVNQNRTTNTHDTNTELKNNPPQIKVRWKKTYPTPPTVGMVYKDGIFYCPMTDGINIDNMILNSDNIEFGTTDATSFIVPVTENKYDKTQFTNIEIDYYTSDNATEQTLTIPLSSYGTVPSNFSFGVYRDRNNTLTAWYALANGNTLSFYNHLVRLNNSITVYVTRVEVV